MGRSRCGLAWLLAVALLTGCAARPGGGTPPPDSPTPAAPGGPPASDPVVVPSSPPEGQPAVVPVVDPCAPTQISPATLEVYGAFSLRRMVPPGNCQFLVDTGPLRLQAQVAAEDADKALQAVQVAGTRQTWSSVVNPYKAGVWTVELNLDSGAAGEEIRVTLPNPTPAAPPMTATLVRRVGPTVHVTWLQEDGAWAVLAPGATLPPGPKTLRFQIEGGRAALQDDFYDINWQPLTPDDFTLLPDGVAEAHFRTPPPMVQVNLEGLLGTDGLRVPADTLTHFYLGEPPTLAQLDLTTGRSKTIGPAPPSIYGTVVRPDGRYAALVAPAPDSGMDLQVWLSELSTGRLTMTPFRYSLLDDRTEPIFDAKGRLIAPLVGGHLGVLDPATGQAQTLDSAATFWEAFSRDGRYAAGRGGGPRGIGLGAWVGPPRAVHLVIRDLVQGTEQVFPWEGYYGGLTWLDDGRLVQTIIHSNREPSSGEDTARHSFTVDLQTGARTPYADPLPPPSGVVQPPGAYHPEQPGDRFLTMLQGNQALVFRWSNPSPLRTWRGP